MTDSPFRGCGGAPRLRLVPFHDASAPACTLEVSVEWHNDGLQLLYFLQGALDTLALPAFTAVTPGSQLWERTCFEAFMQADGGPGYREFNYAPSGAWASYAFTTYRAADNTTDARQAPQISASRGAAHLVLSVRQPLPPALATAGLLHLGLSAVLETCDGRRSYWALHHAAPQPDFHRAESFTLVLPQPAAD
ncbi:MAG: DOMON-like domain-containing protein [Nevskiaceae bacterium]|nr:MAG: DOMON-like domain-containing protein [Nevskiaceae bacterium]TBR72779.1 MAG: DOMON-like domain-containing protein [Nevskiaceae bacterium]